MEWNSGFSQAVAMVLVFAFAPTVLRKHKEAHEEAKRRMPEGWLKWLVTHELGKRRTNQPGGVRVIGQHPLQSVTKRNDPVIDSPVYRRRTRP